MMYCNSQATKLGILRHDALLSFAPSPSARLTLTETNILLLICSTIAASYSSGSDALASVLEPTPNDNSGDGQYQIGMLKKPTGTDDVVNSGYQESGIDEGTIYGGIFLEDSSGGCVSTQAQKRRLRSKIRRTL